MYTTQFTTAGNQGQQLVAIKTNGGSVTIEKQVGTDWVVADVIATDGVYPMNLGRTPVRFTPAGGAAFEVGA